MRGLVFTLDSTLAIFFGIVTVAIGMQLISNITNSNQSKLQSLEIASVTFSNRLVSYCFDEGGVAYCRGGVIYEREVDARALQGLAFQSEVEKYQEKSRVNFKVGFDYDEVSGAFCIARLLKVHGKNEEAILKICAE